MSRSTRRGFVQQSAALGLGLSAGLSGRAFAANDKISIACIGVRGWGNSVMRSFAAEPDCAVTHICDVRESTRQERGAQIKESTGRMPKLVVDYRTLLDDASVDVFMVATPDHWHALPTIHGCLAGKDVYVEKPSSHNILEGKTAVAAARKNDCMVQVGTQIRSAPFLRDVAQYVQSGAMGKVIYGKAWETARNGAVHLAADGQPPSGFDYELWQGPAPERPYNGSIVGGAWRWLFDYGTGDLGNDGVHRIDYCRYVMGLEGMPEAISCSGGKFFFEDDQEWPDTMLVNYEYPRQNRPVRDAALVEAKALQRRRGSRYLRRKRLGDGDQQRVEGLRPRRQRDQRGRRQLGRNPAGPHSQFPRRRQEPPPRFAQPGDLLRSRQHGDVSCRQHFLAYRQEAPLGRQDRDVRRRGGQPIRRPRTPQRLRTAGDRIGDFSPKNRDSRDITYESHERLRRIV